MIDYTGVMHPMGHIDICSSSKPHKCAHLPWQVLCPEPVGTQAHVDSNVLIVLSAYRFPELREAAARPRAANGGGAAIAQAGVVKKWFDESFPAATVEGRRNRRDCVNALQLVNKVRELSFPPLPLPCNDAAVHGSPRS